MLEVSVVVPAHNASATLSRTLGALEAQDLDAPYEVLVVDDGSDDQTARIAEGAGRGVTLIRQASAGASAARNRGAAAARAPILAFTDADCFPASHWLRSGLAACDSADLVVGSVTPEGFPGPFDRSLGVEREGLYETANLFVRKDLFHRVGGFEEWLFDRGRPLGEDVWFGWRARRMGARTAFCPEAHVEHAVFPGTPRTLMAERLRLRHFPQIVARIPELRDSLLYRRRFLSGRTARFDAALAGVALAAITRSPLPLAAMTPYASLIAREVSPWRRRAPLVAAVTAAADTVGFGALAYGSIRRRALVV